MRTIKVTLYWMRVKDLNEVLGDGTVSALAWAEAEAKKLVKNLRPKSRVFMDRDNTVDIPGRWDAGRFVKIEDNTGDHPLYTPLFERVVEDAIINYIRMRSTRV